MGNTAELDKDLADGLKAAKTKRCYFVLVMKGGTDGALLVSKTKIAAPAIAEAKKKSGGSAVVTGFVSYADSAYVFETAKIPPGTAAQAAKTIVKRDAGVSIHAIFRMGTDPELAASDGAPDGQSGATGTTATKPTQTADPKAKPTIGPLPEAGKYAAALNTWEQAAAVAMSAVEKLVSALEAEGSELALAISGIIQLAQSDFPDTLDDALSGLAKASKAGNTADTEQFRFKSEIAIRAALAYLNNNAKTFEGCEKNPFGVSVQIRAPLTEALKQVLIAVKK